MEKEKAALISLGCDKNLVDSEVMLGILQKEGFQVTSLEEEAQVIIINTCCFIQDALEESIETILEAAQLKKTGACKALIITGCLGQRYEKELFSQLPEVDAVLGAADYENIAEVARAVLTGESHIKCITDINRCPNEELSKLRVLSTPGYYGYLKIAEGCDSHCTYCVIPKIRGRYRSRSLESLIEEAKELAEQGVKELILVAQDTAVYGKDIYGTPKLDVLLEGLCAIEGLEWIRILYCYPEHITDETIVVMAREQKICHYLDMPIQHGCDSVLKRMGRRSTQEIIRSTVRKLRKAMPDITLRTTVITGFPQETEEELEEAINFFEEIGFDKLGVFTYSQEENTPAAGMDGQIAEEEKQRRKDRVMEAQKEISAKKCLEQIGTVQRVIIEGKLPEENVYCARSYQDAPDIDGLVFAHSSRELMSGDFADVLITQASDYDLIGDVIDADEFAQ